MNNFEYCAPETIPEAIELLQEHGEAAKPLAGGTDLLLLMRDWRQTPEILVDLKRVGALQGIRELADGGVQVGALTPMRDLEVNATMRAKYPHLVSAIREVGSIQIRNLATLGGNACNASPGADTPPALLTLDAQVLLRGPEGERALPLRDFFVGPGKTVLTRGEILTDFILPAPIPNSGGCYVKLANRRAMDIAFVGVASHVALNGGDTIARAKVAIAAAAPVPLCVDDVEAILQGQSITQEVIDEAAKAAGAACRPITDHRASLEYRQKMVEVLTRRTLSHAIKQARTQQASG